MWEEVCPKTVLGTTCLSSSATHNTLPALWKAVSYWQLSKKTHWHHPHKCQRLALLLWPVWKGLYSPTNPCKPYECSPWNQTLQMQVTSNSNHILYLTYLVGTVLTATKMAATVRTTRRRPTATSTQGWARWAPLGRAWWQWCPGPWRGQGQGQGHSHPGAAQPYEVSLSSLNWTYWPFSFRRQRAVVTEQGNSWFDKHHF